MTLIERINQTQCCDPHIDSLLTAARDQLAALTAERDQMAEENADYERGFELRWKADMRAIERWRANKPGRKLILPDHADLCVWLLAERDAMKVEFAEYETRAEDKYAELWAERNGWQARAEMAEAEGQKLHAALEAVEWGYLTGARDGDGLVPACAECIRRETEGHAPECIVGLALYKHGEGKCKTP